MVIALAVGALSLTSGVRVGQGGAKVYAIAGALAHNTGRMFIDDPNGVTKMAIRRRAKDMFSLALRDGTRGFIAPHPDQIKCDAAEGVPPPPWVYGDDEGKDEMAYWIALVPQLVEIPPVA